MLGPSSDLQLRHGTLWARRRGSRCYLPIAPESVLSVSESVWHRNVTGKVWLRVRTAGATYCVAGRRDDYDEIVEWLASATGFDVRRSPDYPVNAVVFRWPVQGVFKALVRQLRRLLIRR